MIKASNPFKLVNHELNKIIPKLYNLYCYFKVNTKYFYLDCISHL